MPTIEVAVQDGLATPTSNRRPEGDQNAAENIYSDLPPSSPIQSPGSIASVTDREDDFDDKELGDILGVKDENDTDCSGQWVQWTPGAIWNTYPYQRHDKNDLPWVPIGWRKGWIQIRSFECAQQLVTDIEKESGTCNDCYDLLNSRALIKLMERASTNDLDPRTLWNYLTSAQLKALLLEKEKKIQLLKFQVRSSL